MRFVQAIFLGLFLLSNAEGKGGFHIKGPFDLDEDGQKECLILNTNDYSILLVETGVSDQMDTVWYHNMVNGITLSDGVMLDLDADGFEELVLIPNIINADDSQPWLYIFKGQKNGLADEPIAYDKAPLSLTTLRPSNLTLTNNLSNPLGVCFASPIRQGLLFNIDISNNQLKLFNLKLISNSKTSNGYGVVQMSSFSNDGQDYLAMLSVEKDSLHTAIFNINNDYELLRSKTLVLDSAQLILSSSIMSYNSNNKGQNGLLIPLKSDDVYLLNVLENDVFISTTNVSQKGAFPTDETVKIKSILQSRENIIALDAQPASSNYFFSRIEKNKLPPPGSDFSKEFSDLDMKIISEDRKLTSIPKNQHKVLYKPPIKNTKNKDYSMLSPTLGDFLTDAKKDLKNPVNKEKKTSIPLFNKDMKSTGWADEAGFTQMHIGEYISEDIDTATVDPIPVLDSGVTTFTQQAKEALVIGSKNQDSILAIQSDGEIDLYYVLVMTPASQTRDRYVFDGEAPFGVAVNQIPQTGKATHFQHGISADLSNLKNGETFDFSYSLRDGTLDSITTLTMVHDLQTNIVLMSISPTNDSISQSYQPESFDPKLFEFPNYFFEGFPTSLDMDFKDKLIRFSFDGMQDSIYQGIYLSSTTPSDPPQSLAVFMDQGNLQSVKGEVAVRANGSKKITTQYDLTGSVEPALMFSKLIQESFPEELKVKLLQGASLEEPLFGPKGKAPKIIREPRLPEVQSALPEQDIPISPKRSIIPNANSKTEKIKTPNSFNIPETQKSEIEPEVFNVKELNDKKEKKAIDLLKLEESKNSLKPDSNKSLPKPKNNKSEPDILKSADE